MPAETVMSGTLTNLTSTPLKVNDARLAGKNFMKRETCTATTGKTSGGFYGFFRIPASAIIVSCELSCDALSTSTAADIGLWEVSNPFAPVTTAGGISNSSQYFGAAVSLASALTKQQQLIQSSWTTRAKMTGKRVWEILGLAADPSQSANGSVEYDVVATNTTTITAGGVIVLEISYKMP